MYSINRFQTCSKFRKSSYSKTWSRVWLFCNSDTNGSRAVTVKICVCISNGYQMHTFLYSNLQCTLVCFLNITFATYH